MERGNSTISSASINYALEIFSSDAFLTVNKKLLSKFGPEVAIYLSNLVDQYKYCKDKETLTNDWFYLTNDLQILQTGMTITKLRNCKQALKDIGILETQLAGAPPKEQYKLDFSKLLTTVLVIRQDSLPLTVRNPDGSINKINLISYNNTIDKKEKNKQKRQKYLPLANYLSQIIKLHKNINHTPSQLEAWTHPICSLADSFSNTENPYGRIRTALRFYEKHIGEQYMVEIESGKSLKEKFPKLEAAMSREQKPDTKKKTIIHGGEKYTLSGDGYYYNNEGRRYID